MPKIIGLKQLLSKKYKYIEGLTEEIVESFGKLVNNFIMIVWGMSGNGKSNFIMQFLIPLMEVGNILYIGLEEGFEATMQLNADRNFDQAVHSGKIVFADHEMSYDELVKKLKKKKSPQFIVIDSIQYWNITYDDYKRLKEMFPKKTFIFISHAAGKLPDGKTADKIRYDAGIKVRVEGFVAFIISRYGGSKPFVINEPRAKKYWGKKYSRIVAGLEPEKEKKKPKPKKNEKTPVPQDKFLERPEELVLGAQHEVEQAQQGVLS